MQVPDSERLSFYLMNHNHAQQLFELDQDPAVMKYINGGQKTSRADINNKFIPRVQSFTNPEQGWGLWGVKITTNQKFIGWILIRPMEFFTAQPEHNNLEIGWRFKQASWGKGYATEAANAVLNSVAEQTGVNTFSALADKDNKASINIMQKLGMRYLKSYQHQGSQGEISAVYYQLTADNSSLIK